MISKFIFRNLMKRPFLNFVKILGLAFALTGLIILALFIKNELSYDQSHKNADRLYRFTFTSENIFGGKQFARIQNAAIIPQMADYFKEIENYTRLARVEESFLKYGNKFIKINQAFHCDSTFFEVFNGELLIGDSKNILDNPGTMIISEGFAEKVFGDSNPIGQILTMPVGQFNADEVDYLVQGIMKDYPKNNHFHPDYITSPVDKSVLNGWAWSYLLLLEDADPDIIISGFPDFGSATWDIEKSEITLKPYLQNIKDIHLHSNKLREIEPNGSLTVVYTFSAAALLLLFIALINYANLNIGMAEFSGKFMHINKISGATRKVSIKYYLLDGLIITAFSVFLSLILADFFGGSIQKSLGLNLFEDNTRIIVLIIICFIFLCLIASSLPLVKQTLNRAASTHNINDHGIKRKGISKGLIVLQYTISIALIFVVLLIHKQTKYSLRSGLGSHIENLICIDGVHADVQSKFSIFKTELKKYEPIISVSAMFEPPGGEANDMFPFEMEGYVSKNEDGENELIGVFPCDKSLISLFNLNLLSGKDFSEDAEDQDGSGEYIVNESAMKRLGYSNPDEIIGKKFKLIFFNESIQIPDGEIIAVVKDFHYSSLKKEIEPKVFFKRKDHWIENFIVLFKPGNKTEALEAVKTTWNNLFPYYPFNYNYIDSMYRNVYRAEILQSKLIALFTIISLFICSIGLLGMSLLVTQKRTKEIGIRKVNGASESQIILMLNWNLLKWVLLSFILSIPLAYIAMNKWLENFAYKISISWWIFIISGFITILISFFTISVISWKTARSNPVKALRYE